MKINWGKLKELRLLTWPVIKKNMPLHDFLEKAKDSKINKYELDRHWRELNSKRYALENLDQSDRELIYEIIKEYREDWLSHRYPASVDLRRAYNRIYSQRKELKLDRDDLDDIKQVIYSFKK
jgi:hypothetical protein